MTRLNGIQKAMVVHPSAFLLNLENDLLRDLDTVLNQEEEIWALKSRVSWMIQGDRNTAFYHVSTLVRRKRNKILAIKNAVGDWIQQEEVVKDFVKNGYSEIYTTSFSSVSALPPMISSWQVRLSEEEICSISGEVSDEEIKAALCSLKAFKAPGPNGLHAGFFQRFWLTVGSSVINEVKKSLLKGEFRITLILLILPLFLRFKVRRRLIIIGPSACVIRCIKLCRRSLLSS